MTVESIPNVSTIEASTVLPKETQSNSEVKTVSPAQDLRDIQALLVTGIFQGNMAPSVVKAYGLLEKMCVEIESKGA